ncbi:MAG TPA: lytic transglycosylase domain-containing protein [Candidatus Dormibacteraeota bacterium]|nr:lytic transglycosylase domain-containing protein [Candidatus Dormibacteraeota bacterium]
MRLTPTKLQMGPMRRWARALCVCAAALLTAPALLHAEYVVLRNGQRLNVTGYELRNGTYHFQMNGGSVDLSASEVLNIEPQEIFTRVLPAVPVSNAPYEQLIRNAAARNNLDPDLIASVIGAESNFNPKAVSRKNARGLMQLLPETAKRFGVKNIFDPRENIEAGTRYLGGLLQLYKNNLVLALAAYNAGPQRVTQYGSVPPYHETVAYVSRVSRSYAKRKTTREIPKTTAIAVTPAAVTAPAGL